MVILWLFCNKPHPNFQGLLGLLGGLIDTASPSNLKNPVSNCAFGEKESEKEIRHNLLEIIYEEMQKTIPVTRNSISNFTHGCYKKSIRYFKFTTKYLDINLEKHALP